MKRCLSIIGVLFLLAHASYGQLNLRAFGGINSTSFKGKYEGEISDVNQMKLDSFYGSIINPSLGLQLQFKISERVNFSLESQIIFKGQKYNNNSNIERSLYVELIPSIDMRLWNGISLGLGYYGGIRPYSYFSEQNSVSLANYKRDDWDYGFMASLSYSFKRMTFRIAHFRGLNTIFLEPIPVGPIIEKQNSVFQLGIGYTLSGSMPSGNGGR